MKNQINQSAIEWKEVQLKDLIGCIESGMRPKGGVSGINEGIPSIGGEHINKFGGFNFVNLRFVSKDFYDKQKRGHIKIGDVLVVKDGATTGRVTWASAKSFPYEKSSVNEHVFILRPIKSVMPEVLFYYLYSPNGQKQILDNFHGSAQGGINTQFVKNVKIPIPFRNGQPDLETQKAIVSILEKAEQLKDKRKQSIKLLDEYVKSVFNEMFGDSVNNEKGWSKYKLGDVCEDFQNGIGKNIENYGRGQKVANIGGLYAWHKFSPTKNSLLDVTDEEIKRYKLKLGDILFVRSSLKPEGVAYCSMYNSEELCLFSSFMIRIRSIKSKLIPDFLSFLLRTPNMRKNLIKAANTVTISNISQPNLKKIVVICPPLPLQQKFASIVEHVEQLKEKQNQSLKEIEQLFNALMQKAFNGELVK